MATGRLTLHPIAVHSNEATGLLREYVTELELRFHGKSPTTNEVDAALAEQQSDDLDPPGGVFLLVRVDFHTIGCVGVRRLAPEVFEVKRMYVRPDFRRMAYGHLLLGAVEDHARDMGATLMRLDTRSELTEARALYAAHGYVEIPDYNGSRKADRWYGKSLIAG